VKREFLGNRTASKAKISSYLDLYDACKKDSESITANNNLTSAGVSIKASI